MALYSNTYRVESSRLKGWDYSNPGLYYVTICTKNMKKFFGKIGKGVVNHSNEGKIVNEEWLQSAVLRSYIILDEYVIMPNHFHGILAIIDKQNNTSFETTQRVVFTRETLKPNSLSSIVGQFKSKCTKRIKKINSNFEWHGRFHDRIIRSEKELDNIREYIIYNPIKWIKDEFYIA